MLMTKRVRCYMSCAGLSWWGRRGWWVMKKIDIGIMAIILSIMFIILAIFEIIFFSI